jgi:sporulation protein YlmC with PRC-barrel domain
MTIQHKNLLNLPVITQGGTHLGYVTSFEIDELDQRIKQYIIKTHHGLAGLFDKQLIISVHQVVSLSHDKMVVEDAIRKQSTTNQTELSAKSTIPADH